MQSLTIDFDFPFTLKIKYDRVIAIIDTHINKAVWRWRAIFRFGFDVAKLLICPGQFEKTILQPVDRVHHRSLRLGDPHRISIVHMACFHHVADASGAGSVRTREAVYHHILALRQSFVDECVGWFKKGYDFFWCRHICFKEILTDAVSEVSETWIIFMKV